MRCSMAEEVEEYLEILEHIHSSALAVKKAIKAEVEARYADELSGVLRAESIAAREARSRGASLARIGKAMGTTDWRTIKERLALAGEKEEK